MDFKLLSCLIFLILWLSSSSTALDSNEPSYGLSAEQESALLKFRSLLQDNWPWQEEFSDDRMLLRFLLEEDFNLEEALESILSHLSWRKYLRIDGILDADWKDMEEPFPYEIKVGASPPLDKAVVVLHWYLGKWDFLSLIPSNEFHARFIRYAAGKMMEDADRQALLLASTVPGANSPKFHVILDLMGQSWLKNIMQNLVESLAKEWRHATQLFIFTNLTNVPDIVCGWSTEGKLVCPSEHSGRDKLEL